MNTIDQKSMILVINALIFSHLDNCSWILGKCSEKLQYEYLKRDRVTPLLKDVNWINFSSVLRLNQTSFMHAYIKISREQQIQM